MHISLYVFVVGKEMDRTVTRERRESKKNERENQEKMRENHEKMRENHSCDWY